MNAPQANEKLRIPQFHNEWVDIIAFEQRRGGHQWPDAATFKSEDWMKTAIVYLRREDWPLFKRAGFDLRGRVGELPEGEPPIEALIQNDYVVAVRGRDGTEYTHEQREPVLHVVGSAAPAINPDNGEIHTPLAFVEPPLVEPRRGGDDGGNGYMPVGGKARLYAKMAQVMANLRAIPKRGKNREQGYEYVTDADLYDAVRTEMAKANLALLVRMVDIRKESETKSYKDGGSKTTTTTLVDLDFTLCCGDTGATETIRWTGSTLNPGDKAISAAVTVAEKYFLKATFIISTGEVADDPDSGMGDETPRSSGVSRRQNPPRQQQPAAPPEPEATPEAAKSQPVHDSVPLSEPTGPTTEAGTAEAVDMPDDLFQALMKDKDIIAASKAAPERAATIRKLWAEGGITAEMDEFDRVMAVIDRLNAHRKGGDK